MRSRHTSWIAALRCCTLDRKASEYLPHLKTAQAAGGRTVPFHRSVALALLAAAPFACSIVAGPRPESAVPVSLFVRPSESPKAVPADGSEARPYASLAEALRVAPAGAMLLLDEGEYRERVVIARPVVLLGKGAARTRFVVPAGSDPAIVVRSDVDQVRIQGLSIEGGDYGISFLGGAGHRLENVELRGMAESALVGRGAAVAVRGGAVLDVGQGTAGRAIDFLGGILELHGVRLSSAGRRAIQVRATRGLFENLEVDHAGLSAVQALDGAEVIVRSGRFSGMGGAAFYAAASRLVVEGAQIAHSEFGVVGARGALLELTSVELEDYRVAAIALVKSRGTITGCHISRGGSEAAVTVIGRDPDGEVSLVRNRIQRPGPFGVHVTQGRVVAQGNTITGARLDREGEMGDAFFAVDSELRLEENVVRGNAGSGVVSLRSKVELRANGMVENGRSGVLLLDASRVEATGNYFDLNHAAAVEVGEGTRARLDRNQFGRRGAWDLDTGCGVHRGLATLSGDEAAGLRLRGCP